MVAQNTARLAALLGVDAALVTWTGSGNAFVEVMLTIRALEERGIKTTLVTYEYGGKDGIDSPLLYYVPEANAAVSSGSRDRWIELPEAERIVGPYEKIKVLSYPGAPLTSARGQFTLDARDMIVGGDYDLLLSGNIADSSDPADFLRKLQDDAKRAGGAVHPPSR